MPIVAFNFDKIVLEKKTQITNKVRIDIKNNINIKEVKEEKLFTPNKEDCLRFDFFFGLDYTPNIGNISFTGHIIYFDEQKKLKEIIKDWNKNKKIPQEIMGQIVNTILFRANMKALSLCESVNLPPHLKMPRLSPKAKTDNYIG